MSSIVEFSRYLSWAYPNYKMSDCDTWMRWTKKNWNLGIQYDFVTERIADGKFIGGVGILDVDFVNRKGNLGYFTRTDETGKGITTAAARLAIRFAQEQMGLKTLHIYVAVDNIASQRIAEKLGAVYKETLKNHEQINDRMVDSLHYELELRPVVEE